MFGLKSSSRIKTSVKRNWRAIRSTYLVSNFRAATRKHSLSRIVLAQSSILTIAMYRCTIITFLVHWRRKCIVDAQNMNTQSTALSSPVGRSLTGGDHILKLGHVPGRCGKRRKHRVSKVDAFCMQWSLYPGYQGFYFLACGGMLRCHRSTDLRPKAFCVGHYKDFTDTGNRTWKVSGTQRMIMTDVACFGKFLLALNNVTPAGVIWKGDQNERCGCNRVISAPHRIGSFAIWIFYVLFKVRWNKLLSVLPFKDVRFRKGKGAKLQ